VNDVFDQTFIDTLLATKGTPRCLINDHFSKVEFDKVQIFCLPLFIEREIKKISKVNLCQNEVTTSTCFSFIINKKQINRFLCIKLVELFALQGRPDEDFEDVESSEDTLEKEMWDLRLGPAIWDRIRNQFPEDVLTDENKVELQNYLITEIFKLPAKNFLVFMREVISGSQKGKRLMGELMDGIEKMFNDEEYESAVQSFQNDLDDITDETDDDDLKDFLGGLGIDMS
jgi:hypothetical protein